MARRYTLEELLELQHSPLVKVPPDFSPIEEWMGPSATRHSHNNHNRDQSDLNNAHGKSFSFGYSRHTSRNSNSEDLVLGPPKTSFASAFRYFGKSGDSIDRSSRTDDEGVVAAEGDKETERKDGRFSTTNFNGRRNNNRDDREGINWKFDRGRRDVDDHGNNGERRFVGPRSSGERWDLRDRKDREGSDVGNFRNIQRDTEAGAGRYQPRRDRDVGNSNPATGNHQERRKRENRLSGHAGLVNDEDDKPAKSSDWRRGNNSSANASSDKDWKHAKYDQSPEWLYTSGPAVSETPATQVRTQEDFQRWKEQMKSGAKAGAAKTTAESAQGEKDQDRSASDAEKLTIDTDLSSKSNASKNATAHSGPSTSSSRDAGIDQFFSKWAQKVAAETNESPTDPNSMIGSSDSAKKKDKPLPTKSSRFADIFNSSSSPVSGPAQTPKTEASRPPTGPSSSSSTVPKTTEADQEGFQRILQMLGGARAGVSHNANSRSSSVVPQPSLTRPSSSVFNASKSSIASHSPHGSFPPPAPPGFEWANASAVGSHKNTPKNSPKPRAAPPTSESEFLARLMQQTRLSQSHQGVHSNPSTPAQPNAPASQYQAPPGLKTANGMFVDDPAIASISAEAGAPGAPPMKSKSSSQAVYRDEFPIAMGQGNHASPPPLRQNPLGGPRVPLQRPPGFESIQGPPGFVNQPQQQEQGGADGHPVMLPPFAQTPYNRALNPNYQGPMSGPFSPSRPPMYPNLAPPPNYMAPPGFMAAAAAAAAAGFPPPPPHPQALPQGPLPPGSNFPPRQQFHGIPPPQGHPAPQMAGPGNDPMYPGMNMHFNPAALATARGSPAFPPPPISQPIAAGTPRTGSGTGAGVGAPPPGLGGVNHPISPPGMPLNNPASDDYMWVEKEMAKR